MSEKSSKKEIFVGLGLAAFVVLLWLIPRYTLFDYPHRGSYGDMFGSVNSLFSGLAFAGIIFAIFLQRRELSLQREELRLQREEMTKSREELAKQAKLQYAQLKTTLSELKIRSLEAEIAKVEMEAKIYNMPEETHQAVPSIGKIKEKMDSLIEELENKVIT